ncbi:MAG: Transcriptional regulator [Cirrosporium novae-zelandiae]|nr:MAG: Transcriptional regulator [Cirrosporium novae-zelandiae]
MATSTARIFAVYELVELILYNLSSMEEILQAQRVCRTWKTIIKKSKSIRQALWYAVPDGSYNIDTLPTVNKSISPLWKLNPMIARLGISLNVHETGHADVSLIPNNVYDTGDVDLTKGIYDIPGSWATMLATQPPCRMYLIECQSDWLLLGDLMAVLAEAQNRQKGGVDRWAGVVHYSASLYPTKSPEFPEDASRGLIDEERRSILEAMDNNVSVKVVVSQAWGSGDYPAFSLKQKGLLKDKPRRGLDPEDGYGFRHELITHEMDYQWDWAHHSEHKMYPPFTNYEYHARLLEDEPSCKR